MADKIKDIITETIPEFEFIAEDIPGLTSEKLDANVSIRGIPIQPGQEHYVDEIIVGSNNTSFKVTTGFKPGYIKIYAFFVNPGSAKSESWTSIDTDGNITTLIKIDGGGAGEIVYLSSINFCTLTSIEEDGFILNVRAFSQYYLQIESIGQ